MSDDVGVDESVLVRSIRGLLDAAGELNAHKFAFGDARVLRLRCTAEFDRAVHSFAWSGVQVVTGSCDGFVGAAEAMVVSAGAILDVDADVVDGMRQARELIDGPVR